MYIYICICGGSMCICIGVHEKDIVPAGAGVTGSCEHLLWTLGIELGSPARAVCALLTTELSLQCLSFLCNGAENSTQDLVHDGQIHTYMHR